MRKNARYVYFIQAENGFIKIGLSSRVDARIRELQTGSPVALTLLKTIAGSDSKEAALHERFKHLRKHNEWFEPGEDLLAFIAEAHTKRDFLEEGELARPKELWRIISREEREVAAKLWSTILLWPGTKARRFVAHVMSDRTINNAGVHILNLIADTPPGKEIAPQFLALIDDYYVHDDI